MTPPARDNGGKSAEEERALGAANLRDLVVSSFRATRANIRKLFLRFALLAIAGYVASGAASVAADELDLALILVTALQVAALAAFVLIASLFAAQASVVIVDWMRGIDKNMRDAGAELRPLRSALLAAAFYAVMLAFAAALIPFFGAFITPIVIGPPVLIHVVALESQPLAAAGARARDLWRGQLLRVFMYLFALSVGLVLIQATMLGAIDSIYENLGGPEGEPYPTVLNGVILGLTSGILLPFMACAALACYLDLRRRSEAGDVEDLANHGDGES